VVEREVAHHPHVPGVRLLGKGLQAGVAAQQRVDFVEGGRVVAVRAAGGEERGEIHHVGTQSRNVVEMLGSPVEVAAEQFTAPVGALRQV